MSNHKRRLLNFRLSDDEAEILAAYCEQVERTQTDVLREFIRGLERRLTQPRKQRPGVATKPKAASVFLDQIRRSA